MSHGHTTGWVLSYQLTKCMSKMKTLKKNNGLHRLRDTIISYVNFILYDVCMTVRKRRLRRKRLAPQGSELGGGREHFPPRILYIYSVQI